jgi:fused signal recognition particle receptor
MLVGFFSKLKKIWQEDIMGRPISPDDAAFFEELEERMILSDVGVETATEAVEQLRSRMKREGISGEKAVRGALREILAGMLNVGDGALDLEKKPAVVLFIGVNGVGKTTSIGKLGYQLKKTGKKVLFCGADTFRAAAADQLEIWAERAGCELVRSREGADPGAVVYDALAAAKARGTDVVLCDTAGRLHNKDHLMKELAKLSKIIDRECPGVSRETLLVLDATTGQNGLIQARAFRETAGLTGIVLTKLDGTAKGGIVIAIARELGVPVKLVGLGEGLSDLRAFDAGEYVEAMI